MHITRRFLMTRAATPIRRGRDYHFLTSGVSRPSTAAQLIPALQPWVILDPSRRWGRRWSGQDHWRRDRFRTLGRPWWVGKGRKGPHPDENGPKRRAKLRPNLCTP